MHPSFNIHSGLDGKEGRSVLDCKEEGRSVLDGREEGRRHNINFMSKILHDLLDIYSSVDVCIQRGSVNNKNAVHV